MTIPYPRFTPLIVLLLSASPLWAGPVEDYKEAAKSMRAEERLAAAQSALTHDQDLGIKKEALKDLLLLSWTPERLEASLAAVENKLAQGSGKIDTDTQLHKARLLARQGKKAEAEVIFLEGRKANWVGAYQHYYDSLQKTDELAKCALLIYRDTWNPEYKAPKDLTYFAETAGKYKIQHPERSAMADIAAQLSDIPAYPQLKTLTEALCMVIDGRFAEGLQQLDRVEASFADTNEGKADLPLSNEDAFYLEYKNLPLYKSWALILEGRDFEAARAAFQEFINRNRPEYHHILKRGLWISWYMDLQQWNKIAEITSFLVNSELITNPEIKREFSEEEFCDLYDMHQAGLAWQGRYEEGAAVALQNMNNYFPRYKSSAFSAMYYAAFVGGNKPDLENRNFVKAEQILENILSNAPYDDLVPHIKRMLAKFYFIHKRYDEAFALIDEAVALTEGIPDGVMKECNERSKRLKESFIKIKSIESNAK